MKRRLKIVFAAAPFANNAYRNTIYQTTCETIKDISLGKNLSPCIFDQRVFWVRNNIIDMLSKSAALLVHMWT